MSEAIDVTDDERFFDLSREFMGEVFGTAFFLEDLMQRVLRTLDDDAFPGLDKREALREAMVYSTVPVAAAAGEDACVNATALVAAMRERIVADVKHVVEGDEGPQG